jgi:Protein of unknown function (DUF3379)
MKHNQARLLIGADPGSVPPELAEHLKNCPECGQFQREMLTLDESIRRALDQEPMTAAAAPTSAGSVVSIASARAASERKPVPVWSGWAVAASVAVLSVLAMWTLLPTESLARDLATHVGYEPSSWDSKHPASPAMARAILAKAGVALDMNSDDITYARTCLFRGHVVPHLVVKTPQGPVTVLILPNEKIKSRMSFQEDGMTGVITPTAHGSIAVLTRGSEKNVDAIAQQVQGSVRWLGAT